MECTCCQGQPISLPLTPASVKSRTQSCSPGPISKPPAADQLSNLFESLPANILSSVENLETHPADNTIDLFPSNASSISQASSISDYQDFPELLNTPDFVSSLAFGNEHIPVDPVAFGKFVSRLWCLQLSVSFCDRYDFLILLASLKVDTLSCLGSCGNTVPFISFP